MRRQSSSTVVIRSIDSRQVREAVDEYAGRLLAFRPEVEEIVVFGSFSKDTYAPGSDLDVFLILKSSDKSFRDRIPEYLPGAFPVGVDLFPYTRDEVARMGESAFLAEVQASDWRYRRSK